MEEEVETELSHRWPETDVIADPKTQRGEWTIERVHSLGEPIALNEYRSDAQFSPRAWIVEDTVGSVFAGQEMEWIPVG